MPKGVPTPFQPPVLPPPLYPLGLEAPLGGAHNPKIAIVEAHTTRWPKAGLVLYFSYFSYALLSLSINPMLGQKEITMKLLNAVVIGLMIGGPVSGQEYDPARFVSDSRKLSLCMLRVIQGDLEAAKEHIPLGFSGQEECQEAIDKKMEELKVGDELRECLSLVEQDEIVNAALKIALGFEGQEKCEEAIDQKKLERKELAEQQMQALERRNNSLIDQDILAACTELFDEKRTMAMTNSVCVRAFRQLGHPELKR